MEWNPVPFLILSVSYLPSQSKVHGVQKKAYRVLEEVCASSQGPAARFVQNHLDDLKKTLLDSLRSTSSPAKRVRAPSCLVCKGERVSTGVPRGPGDTGGLQCCCAHSPV